ncbi:DUF397 domain-containing protein [Streptomyces sp. NPDC007076]|uniref:DUF397 domain-containing protein n=1 Tax=Streptomyces sp. NPDC007076 TaxID=3160975 RepID=UPI003403C9F1
MEVQRVRRPVRLRGVRCYRHRKRRCQDSKFPNGPALIFGRDALSAMVDAVAGGLV